MPAPVSAAALQGRLNQFLEGIPCNYDTYISLELDWPSLSLQWTRQQQLHEGPADSDGQQSSFSLLLGTQTDGQEDNQVLLLPTHLPQDHYQHAPEDLEQQLLLGPAKGVTAVPADADVNRAVALPAAPHLVATCSDSPAVALLQLDAALEGQPPEAYAATCELSAGSFALAWHPSPDVPASSALLLSGDVQGNLVLLDAHLSKQQAWQLTGGAINAVAWHHTSRHQAAAAMSDGRLQLIDTRQQQQQQACDSMHLCGPDSSGSSSSRRDGQELDVLAVEFDPFHDSQVAAGAQDGTMCVFDLRRLQQPLLRLVKHTGAVTCLSWSRLTRGVLATGGADGYVLLWDVTAAVAGSGTFCEGAAGASPGPSRSRQPQDQSLPFLPKRPGHQQPAFQPVAGRNNTDSSRTGAFGGKHQLWLPAAAGGASSAPSSMAAAEASSRLAHVTQELCELLVPGLVFVHAGHMSAVTDVAWHPEVQGVLASVSYGTEQAVDNRLVQGNIVQVWRPSLVLDALAG